MPKVYFFVDGKPAKIEPNQSVRLTAGIKFIDKHSGAEFLVVMVEATDSEARVFTTKID